MDENEVIFDSIWMWLHLYLTQSEGDVNYVVYVHLHWPTLKVMSPSDLVRGALDKEERNTREGASSLVLTCQDEDGWDWGDFWFNLDVTSPLFDPIWMWRNLYWPNLKVTSSLMAQSEGEVNFVVLIWRSTHLHWPTLTSPSDSVRGVLDKDKAA